jgi:hypothetical protein
MGGFSGSPSWSTCVAVVLAPAVGPIPVDGKCYEDSVTGSAIEQTFLNLLCIHSCMPSASVMF